jgi:23S rRNA (cytosine1962-C5)-methyltransferase
MYERAAVLSIYDDELEPTELDAIVEALDHIGVEQTYVKFRPKHASRIVDSRRLEIAPALPLRGEPKPAAFEVVELGTPFEVHLGDGLSTGLFLDQRENRARIRELAKDKRVLNLFAYTGSFSVVAALGGARASNTVDVSRVVLEWATRNLERVGADTKQHIVTELEVFTFLERAKARGETWDLVVLDPPSFSTTKHATFSAESDLARLLGLTLKVVAPGGKLLACTNHREIVMAKLRRHVHEAARAAGVTLAQVKSLTSPVDFPPPPGREPHLKSVLATVAS